MIHDITAKITIPNQNKDIEFWAIVSSYAKRTEQRIWKKNFRHARYVNAIYQPYKEVNFQS